MAPAANDENEQYQRLNCITEENAVHDGDFQDGNIAADGQSLVMNTLKKRIEEIDVDACDPGDEDAFYVADMGEVYRQHIRWKMSLSRVKPHYGEKPFPSSMRNAINSIQLSSATRTRMS